MDAVLHIVVPKIFAVHVATAYAIFWVLTLQIL